MRPFASLLLNGEGPAANSEGAFDAPNPLNSLTEEQRNIWDGVIGPMHFLSRMVTTSPGVQPEVMTVLRKAWQDAIADQKFRSDFERIIDQQISVFDDGAVLQEEVARIEAAFKANQDAVGELTQRMFNKYVGN